MVLFSLMIVYLQHLSSVKVQYNNLGPNKSDFAAQKDKNSSKNRVLLPQIVVVSTQDAFKLYVNLVPKLFPCARLSLYICARSVFKPAWASRYLRVFLHRYQQFLDIAFELKTSLIQIRLEKIASIYSKLK